MAKIATGKTYANILAGNAINNAINAVLNSGALKNSSRGSAASSVDTPQTTSVVDENGDKQTGYVSQNDDENEGLNYQDYLGAETYDPDVDYQALINQAAAEENYGAAAELENTRNMKIKGEELAEYGLTYEYHNSDWSPGGEEENDSGGGTYMDGLMDALQEQYRKALKANDELTAASVQRAIDQLNAQKRQMGRQYDQLAKQFYIDRRMGEKNLPQQLAALGYSGGLTESSLLGLATNYQQALAENERSRAQGYTDIERQIADAQLQGEIASAQAAQQLGQNYFSNYASVVQAMQNQANWDRQFGYQEQQDALAAERAAQQDALNYVAWLKQMGYKPTAEDLAAAGIVLPEETVAQTYAGGQGSYMDYETLSKQQELNRNGYTVVDDGIWGPETEKAWTEYQKGTMSSNTYLNFKLTLLAHLKQGDSSTASQIYSNAWDNLNENQRADIKQYLIQNGYDISEV